MSLQHLPVSLQRWLNRNKRTAWRPVTTDGDSRETNSWFGGISNVSDTDDWPDCMDCGEPMRFFLQLDAADLPPGCDLLLPGQVVQLFYCSEDDGCETWEPFLGAQEVRSFSDQKTPVVPPEHLLPFPRKAIVGWEPIDDFPHSEEYRQLGMHVDYDWSTRRLTAEDSEFGNSEATIPPGPDWYELVNGPAGQDKLGGWPAWVQGPEYPRCQLCEQPMQLLFQIDSNDHLPFDFGDCGCGHVTMCPNHRDVFAFGWACY